MYHARLFQDTTGIKVLENIAEKSKEVLEAFKKNETIMNRFGKTIVELQDIRTAVEGLGDAPSRRALEFVLQGTFNLIEKAYVELAYSLIDEQIEELKIDEASFWEEPIIEYIMETWWPKRRVYTNKILMIDINKYPESLEFNWKEFMSEKFYTCGVFNFLKQLRNLLTHVKTSKYHESFTEQLFTKDFLTYWNKMNTAIAIYIISYLVKE